MADALAIIGLVAAIAQFCGLIAKVSKAMQEQQGADSDLPQLFRSVKAELPLLEQALLQIRDQAKNGLVSEDSRKALLDIFAACDKELRALESIVGKLVAKRGSGVWARAQRALTSVSEEKKVKAISEQLHKYISVIGFHHQVCSQAKRPPDAPKPLFQIPFERDSRFVGRSTVLESIKIAFAAQRRVALSGIGGVGKSQIAIEYSYVFHEDRPGASVYWMYASDSSRLEQSYQDIAKKLRLPGWDDSKTNVFQLVCDWLSDEVNGQWLLVLDNVDDLDIFFDSTNKTSTAGSKIEKIRYLPSVAHGRILVTTRDDRVAGRLTARAANIKVEPLSEDEARILFKSQMPHEVDWSAFDAAQLFRELAYLPLSISQACAFIIETKITPAEYLAVLLKDGSLPELLSKDHGDVRRDLASGNSIIKTWTLSFQQIVKQNPRAAEILFLIASFDRQSVPKSLLQNKEETDISFSLAVAVLLAFSFVVLEKDGKRLSMHRLVQLSSRTWLAHENKLLMWQVRGLNLMAEKLPCGTFETWSEFSPYAPHALVVLQCDFPETKHMLEKATVLRRVARYDETQGRLKVAHDRYHQALRIHEKILGPEHAETLDSVSCVASILRAQGNYVESEALHRRALRLRQKTLGPDSRATIDSVSDLAWVLGNLGQMQECERLNRQAVAAREMLLGPKHAGTLVTLNNLAMVVDYGGRYEEAEHLHRRILVAREDTLGPTHPDTLSSCRNLAMVLQYQDNITESIPYCTRALKGRVQLLGWRHPDTLTSLSQYAAVLRSQHKTVEAEEVSRWVLQQRTAVLGDRHSWTLYSLGYLALTLKESGKLDEAEDTNREALGKYLDTLGSHHAHTLTSMHNLAEVLQCRGRVEEAEKMYRETLAAREKYLGQDHPATVKTRMALESLSTEA